MHGLQHGALQESVACLGLRSGMAREDLALPTRDRGETMQQAAARECQEEALAAVEVGSLLAVVNVTRANQVHVMFRAKLLEPKFAPGLESLEVALYDEASIPWPELAFASGEYALRRYFADRSAGREDHHFTELKSRSGG
jgi:ADP-ribose pyrophosphatase YjhB (NUDIX family)